MPESLSVLPQSHNSRRLTSDLKQSELPSFFQPVVQPKLTLTPNDVFEQEADAMAGKVMHIPDTSINSNLFFKPAISPIQRKCADCEQEEGHLQKQEENNSIPDSTSLAENYVGGLKGKGIPLSPAEKSFFEPRFGYDFSGVRLHTNSQANRSAKDLNALAYTHENNIVFGSNRFIPGTEAGKKLIAHELTHVVQQNSGVIQKFVQRAPIDQQLQRKVADSIIQRQELSSDETPTTSTQFPNLTLVKPSLLKGRNTPDYLAMRQPFFNRNIPQLWEADSALRIWQYNFDFLKRFGLSDDLSTTITNFTAPRFIDSQLKAGNPTWWEITDQLLNTTTFVGSVPVLEFTPNFSPVAPSWLKTIFGNNHD